MSASLTASDFLPTATLPVLRARADLLRRVREFFQQRSFLEVETPILSADVVVDRHLDPMFTTLADDPRWPEQGQRLWLQTSPEFGMKRLLAAGAEAIYQVTRAFRNGERGVLHNPEFTIVEWYRRGDDLLSGMRLLSDLCHSVLGRAPAEQLSYRDAFARHVGVDAFTADGHELERAAAARGVSPPAAITADDRDGWLDLLLVELVQPHLGFDRPTILFDYPASQAALARVREGRPPLAERFELFIAGLELANGYHELLDPAELRARAAEANRRRLTDDKPPLPENSRLLAAMEHGLPPCSGTALGFDRLVMVATGATRLEQVMAFPIDRA